MKELENRLKSTPTIYITRDIERALGIDLDIPGYFIISNFSPFAKQIAKNRTNIVLIEENEKLDTWQLLKHEKTIEFINNLENPNILVFKNTLQINRTCKNNNWNLINPNPELSNTIEEKISQIEWLGDMKKYLPGYSVFLCKDIKWEGKNFILQFNRSHTGSGTMLIESEKQLEEIKQKFPNREARTAKYIIGPLFTNNNIVTDNKILIGNINYQITGLKPFTERKFATIGNDWGVVKNILDENQIKQYKKIVLEIGEKLKKDNWKGLFGIDVVVDSAGKLYLLEINARQPASTVFESQLQSHVSRSTYHITSFEAHLASLLNINLDDFDLIDINDGAQIIQRVISNPKKLDIKKLEEKNFNIIKYNNTKPEEDLIRIQSEKSLMQDHNKFNKHAEEILQSYES